MQVTYCPRVHIHEETLCQDKSGIPMSGGVWYKS
jgi:hypothetical protein